MNEDSTKALSKVIRIDESEIQSHLDKMVRGTVEDALNAMLDAEADEMCNAQRYERAPDRVDTRAGLAQGDLLAGQNRRTPPLRSVGQGSIPQRRHLHDGLARVGLQPPVARRPRSCSILRTGRDL